MDILQMHIKVRLGLQQVASNLLGDLSPQEIDIEINKQVNRWWKERFGPANKYQAGFEESPKRIQDLKNLIVRNYTDTTFQSPDEPEVMRFAFPSDINILLEQRTHAYYSKGVTAITKTPVQTTKQVAQLKFVMPESQTTFSTMTIEAFDDNASSVFEIDPTDKASYLYPDNMEHMILTIIASGPYEDGDDNVVEVYWEAYKGIYSKDHFIFVTSSTSALNNITLRLNDVATETANFESYTYTSYAVSGGEYKKVGNKWAQMEDISELLEDPFNTTSAREPITVIHSNYIDVYTNSTFSAQEVIITYLRKPKPVSLNLGWSCELPDYTHDEIVEAAVASLLEGMKAQRYETHQNELNKTE